MKYLILGVNGMAGHILAQYLKEQGYMVLGYARSDSKICETVTGDVCDWEKLENFLDNTSFDVLINATGILNQNVEKNLVSGIYINSLLPHLLANYLKNKASKLIHISTDCVFSGKSGSYAETEEPDAVSIYGRTKALGEVIDNKNLTFRTSIIGPEIKEDGIGLLRWFMNQEKSLTGYGKVFWSGVTTLELAKAVEAAACQNLCGLYHLVNNQKISKYQLLQLFQKHFCRDDIEIVLDEKNISNKTLVNHRTDFDFQVSSYDNMISQMEQWIANHRDLYDREK